MRRWLVLLLSCVSASAAAQEAPEVHRLPAITAAPDVSSSTGRVLTLADALRTARANAPALRQARAVADTAEAQVAVARAPLLPQLTGNASYQRTTANFVLRPGAVPRALTMSKPSASFDTFNFYNFSATASQLVYDFGVLGGTLRASKETAKAQRESERATSLDVDLAVRAAFFTARAAKALLVVAEDALANQERHLGQAQALVEVGTRPAIDVAQARTDVANARVELIRAENAYAIARAQLNQAMGVEGSTDYDVADEQLAQLPFEDAPTDELLVKALEGRADLAAVERQVRAQELTARSVRGGFGPRVSLSTTLSDAGIKIEDLTWNWNAGVLLTWPLLSGGATLAQSRAARATLSGLAAQRDAIRQQIRLEVEQARLGVRAAKAVIEAADEAVSNARERLALAEGRYQAGVGNIIELGDAQLAIKNAEAQRVGAEYDLSTARAALLNALGQAE